MGRTLGKRLRALGWRIGAVVTRSAATSPAAVREIGAGKPYSRLVPEIFDSSVILLSTPDGALGNVARVLANFDAAKLHGKIVLHTSGALDREVLAPLARRGAATGSLHPMQTFSGRGAPKLEKVIFAVEGDPQSRRSRAKNRVFSGRCAGRDSQPEQAGVSRCGHACRGSRFGIVRSCDSSAAENRLQPP